MVSLLIGYVLVRASDVVWLIYRAPGRWWAQLIGWDTNWNATAVLRGWPVPLDPSSTAASAEVWAFPPGFPLVGWVFSSVLGPGSVHAVLVVLNVLFGAAATVMLYRLLCLASAGRRHAWLGALLWTSLPASATFLMGYSDGLFFLLVFAALYAVTTGRYAASVGGLLLASVVKTAVVPFAAAVALTVVVDWRAGRARLRHVVGVGFGAVGAALAWPAVVAVAAGQLDAYSTLASHWTGSTTLFGGVGRAVRQFVDIGAGGFFDLTVLVVTVVCAGLIVLSDRHAPLVVRWTAPLVPLLVLAVDPFASLQRHLWASPATTPVLARMVRSSGALAVAMLVLGVLRAWWIDRFPLGAPGVPPP